MNDENNKIILPKHLQQSDKKENRLFDFLKNNTGIIITAISAFVAVFAFYLKLCSKSYLNSFVKYWNVEPSFVNGISEYWFDTILFGFLMFITTSLSAAVIVVNYRVYLRKVELCKASKKALKQQRKFNKKNERMIKLLKAKLEKKNDSIKNKQLQEELDKVQNKNIRIKNEIYEYLSTENEYHKALHLYVRILILGVGQVFVIFCFPYFFQISDDFFLSIISTFVCFVLYLFVLLFYHTLNFRVRAHRFKTLNLDLYSKSEINSIRNRKISIKRIIKADEQGNITKSDIKSIIILLIVYMAVFFLFSLSTGWFMAQNKKTFLLIKSDNKDYAVIHMDSEYIIAERVEIDSKNATIHTKEQLMIKKENTSLQKITFERISKTKD